MSDVRSSLLDELADRVLAASAQGDRTAVAVDGRSGSGKSTLADELSARLQAFGVLTVRSTTDSFHRPRDERMRLGATSPDGYYVDSHQLSVIVDDLLEPFKAGASTVLAAAFDEPRDQRATRTVELAPSAVLIFDGLFVHRPELRPFWDFSLLLSADRRLDERWLDFLLSELPIDVSERAALIDDRLERARWPRYRKGWSRYLDEVEPERRASVVIDNNDLAAPFALLRSPEG